MTFYKLLKTFTDEHGTNTYKIQFHNDTTLIQLSAGDYISIHWGNIFQPLYDSKTGYLIGFIDAIIK